jgi:hypothetical protein
MTPFKIKYSTGLSDVSFTVGEATRRFSLSEPRAGGAVEYYCQEPLEHATRFSFIENLCSNTLRVACTGLRPVVLDILIKNPFKYCPVLNT